MSNKPNTKALQLYSVPTEDIADLIDEELPGIFEPCECGYPLYWCYNIIPEDRLSEEKEWFQAVGVTVGTRLQAVNICPHCKKDLTN